MVGMENALAAFRALDDGIPHDQRKGWLEQEKTAMRERSIDPKSMMSSTCARRKVISYPMGLTGIDSWMVSLSALSEDR